MTYVETRDGLKLAYRIVGEGPVLVCQPGGPGRASSYLGDLGGLSRHRALAIVDARGTGASERPDDPERLRLNHVAEDLECLREHLGLESMDLLAHSAGAYAAQLFAAAHPNRLRWLVLVTPAARLLQCDPGADLAGIVASRRGEPGYGEAVATSEAGIDDDVALRPLLYGEWNDITAAHAKGADTEMAAAAYAAFRPPPGTVDEAAILAALGELPVPVLVVACDKDAATGIDGARAVAATFPNSRLEVLPGLGHFPWVEDPAAFVALVEDFLSAP